MAQNRGVLIFCRGSSRLGHFFKPSPKFSVRPPLNMITHKMIHDGEKPFVCESCGQGFTRKYHMKQHAKGHGWENPYILVLCGRGFQAKIGLSVHTITVFTRKKESRKNHWKYWRTNSSWILSAGFYLDLFTWGEYVPMGGIAHMCFATYFEKINWSRFYKTYYKMVI